MHQQNQSLQELRHIKNMMERSSRFISLSGISGVSAGICALAGAWFANKKISLYNYEHSAVFNEDKGTYIFRDGTNLLTNHLIEIALLTFIASFATSFLFTYLRSKKTKVPLWDGTTIRLFWNTVIPLAAGGLYLIRSIQLGHYELVTSGCLIFYGLALVNASKYTLGEIRYLGYSELILGIINLWNPGYGLIFWAMGFGVLHIIYGSIMWWKNERTGQK
jgi:uncharacterized membrane protein (UPF0182 family)